MANEEMTREGRNVPDFLLSLMMALYGPFARQLR